MKHLRAGRTLADSKGSTCRQSESAAPDESNRHCQYAQDVGMPEYRCAVECQYMQSSTLPILKRLDAPTLQRLLRAAGYDHSKVHPACYDRFSYMDFMKKLDAHLEEAIDKNHLDGAWACLEDIEKFLRRGSEDEQKLGQYIRDTLHPSWDDTK